jgi:hypothetical protein
MSARVHVTARRDSRRYVGFGSRDGDETPDVSLSVTFDLGNGEAALSALREVVAEAEADIRRAGGR